MSKGSMTNSKTSTAEFATGSLAAISNCNVLKPAKCQKHMHWWYFGPVLLAIVMFLLMGTIFERRIEGLWRRILERRQTVLARAAESQEPPITTNSLHTVKTPSQRTIGSCKAGTTTVGGENELKVEPKIEAKSFCCSYAKKEEKVDDIVKKEL